MAQTATRGASPLYRDIAERTQGELYIGVVGPVRAGKSTFISNFMQQLVLPLVPPGPRRERIVDELPQSGSGKTIMTTRHDERLLRQGYPARGGPRVFQQRHGRSDERDGIGGKRKRIHL